MYMDTRLLLISFAVMVNVFEVNHPCCTALTGFTFGPKQQGYLAEITEPILSKARGPFL